MDPNIYHEPEVPKAPAFPNADRPIDATDIEQEKKEEQIAAQSKPVIHIGDAIQKERAADQENGLKSLRTYQNDMAEAVKNDNVSLIKMALSEKRRQAGEGTYEDIQIEKKKGGVIVIIVGVLVVLGVVAISVAYVGGQFFAKAPEVVSTSTAAGTVAVLKNNFFETEETKNIDITGLDSQDIAKGIKREKAGDIELGHIRSIIFGTKDDATDTVVPLQTAGLLSKLRTRVPDSLLRTLSPYYLFGIYAFNPHDSFIILNIDSYDQAFAGMLEWEPSLENDLGGIIINQQTPTLADLDASSTPKVGSKNIAKPVTPTTFVDRIINNKDTRVLFDASGRIKMLYTFFNQNTIIITSSDIMLRELSTRLTTGKITR